jgi:hypothetical protein
MVMVMQTFYALGILDWTQELLGEAMQQQYEAHQVLAAFERMQQG